MATKLLSDSGLQQIAAASLFIVQCSFFQCITKDRGTCSIVTYKLQRVPIYILTQGTLVAAASSHY